MAELRQMFVKLGIKFDKKSANEAQQGVNRLAQAAKALAAVFVVGKVVQGISRFVKGVAALGDNLDKTSQQLGIGTQALQELRFAANLAGASNQDVSTGLRTLAKSALEAQQGSKSFVDDFKRLGVTVTDASGQLKPAEQLLAELGDGMRALRSDTERTALAQSLLGRSGTKLVPLLKQGTAAIDAQRAEARALGIMDERLIKLSADFTDEQTRLSLAFQGIKNIVAKELLPGFIDTDRAIVDFIKENRKAIKVPIQKFIRGLSGFLAQMGRAFLAAGKSISSMIDLLDPLGKTILKVTAAAVVLTPILFFLFTSPLAPILLVIGAIVLIISELQALGEGGKTLIGPLLEPFLLLVDKIGFVDAALQVLGKAWGALKAAAEPVLDFIGSAISSIVEGLGRVTGIAGLFRGVAGLFGGGGEMELPSALAQPNGGGVAIPPGIARPVPGGGGTTLTNAPRTNVDITVNAPGAAEPGAIADEIDKRMRAMDERNLRNAQQALVPAGA